MRNLKLKIENCKFAIVLVLAFGSLLWTGCQTSPGKIVASSSTTVDHAMQAWAVYVVDGHATPEQEAKVRQYKIRYDIAEDAAVAAYLGFTVTSDKSEWITARDLLRANQKQLLDLVILFTGKK